MYSIFDNGTQVGTAEVTREGLYYLFRCSCAPRGEGIHRIVVNDGENQVDLGICVPDSGKFVLRTRIPVKRLTGDIFSFSVAPEKKVSINIPVQSEMVFDQLDKLNAARLEVANGQPMVVIDESPDQQDSDQNRIYPSKSEPL